MRLFRDTRRVELDILEQRYKKTLDKHYDLLGRIDEAYKAKKFETTVDLCKKDISLVPDLSAYWDGLIKCGQLNNRAFFPTYKRLAILYEKQGRIVDAIRVCEDAIEAGYLDDGTSKGMEGRLKKLRSKL